MLNRKGHIATWLILLGTLVLMITAWYTFLSSNEKVESKAQAAYSSIASVNAERAYVSTLFVSLVNQSRRFASQGDFEKALERHLLKEHDKLSCLNRHQQTFFSLSMKATLLLHLMMVFT